MLKRHLVSARQYLVGDPLNTAGMSLKASFIALHTKHDRRSTSMIPVGDSTRRPINFPSMTLTIIGLNAFVFLLELLKGEAFILRWAFVPVDLMTPHGFLTISTIDQLN
jgi:membrane associated rhomboid family serine protease